MLQAPLARNLERAKHQARQQAWRDGLLRYKLRGYQKPVYDAVWAAILCATVLKFCLNISRRWGKSFVLCLVAVEFAIRRPGSQIRFAAPTGLELRKITGPIMRTIFADCPSEHRPGWNGQDKVWTFANGSQIHIAGVNDGHADDLRGPGADLSLVDEGGFVDDLEYVVGSVLMPQTLDRNGTLLLSSTPPRSPAHSYVGMALECQQKGNYIERDIYSTDYEPEKIALYAEEAGGVESTTFQREYGAKFVRDSKLAVIDEWNDAYVIEFDKEKDELLEFWHKYSALDIGATKMDFQAVLFGHYHFASATLRVENELIDNKVPRMDTEALSKAIGLKEIERWGVGAKIQQRVADNNNPQLLVELSQHGLPFWPTSKDELPAMVNKVRIWVKAGRIWVHPRCKNLIACLKHGVWKDFDFIGREFARLPELGHLDALAALIYLVRNIDEVTNPVPAHFGRSLDPQKTFIPHANQTKVSATGKALQNAFGGRVRPRRGGGGVH